MIGRRDFITALGGVVAAWPIAARALQSERARRIGVLMGNAESDDEGQSGVAAFRDERPGGQSVATSTSRRAGRR